MKPSIRLVVLVSAFVLVLRQAEGAEAPDAWPPARLADARAALKQMQADGLITAAQYHAKEAMLKARQAGTFKGTALSTNAPAEVNLIQNGGFEQINRNSARDRSRWLWWGGWSWGGDYENFWETNRVNVHSGRFSAGIRCTGQTGRIGINTPKLPIIPGADDYVFTVWARGEGDNELFLNFESGMTGSLRQRIGTAWQPVTLHGKPERNANDFTLFIYVTGGGTIYLDDARLVPMGGNLDED